MKKDLKALGLIAGKKKSKQMVNVGYIATTLFVLVLIYSMM
jgi:hypothetical protein